MAEFSVPQKRELRKMQKRAPHCSSGLGKAECFVLGYISFEAQARKIWHYYRNRNKPKTESKSGIPTVELVKSLKYFEIEFGAEALNNLLDSKLDKRGIKSARNLRNGIFHQWTEGDCKEAAQRIDQFHTIFNEFDQAVRSVL